jgi:mono/diheme cytochrome c family protein
MSRAALRLLIAAAAAALATACDGSFAAQELGGAVVPAAVLERGHEVYLRHCGPCHGEDGDGQGPAALGLTPPPRDFRAAVFKFAGVEDRGLPDDAELARVIQGGLAGTAMRPWQLPPTDVHAVIQRIKAFSPPGHGFRDPALTVRAPRLPADPVAPGDLAAAIADGERLYHAVFQCASCHPSYARPERLRAWGLAPRPHAELPLPRWSSTFASVLVPGDFLRHPMRSVADRDPGPALDLEPRDLYRVIAYGLAGPMPGYGHLGERDVWNVVHYVKSLADRRPISPHPSR